MRVLGLEGTAWAASAALYDSETDEIRLETNGYEPEAGGIHPREAAEHMQTALPAVIETVLSDSKPPEVIAFSRGPGLGPCLRIVGTAARTLSQSFDVPLVGVNHMVAHLEIGRHTGGLADPICLNASGANAHLLTYRGGRYRVLGETMDTGVGNAIDKFARHLGWSHPGGPKVEEAARSGEYVELPYVVKGMDFSFSGIVSAAKDLVDEGVPVEDVCRGLEETIFAMLTEVSERALSLTGRDSLVVGGGVTNNERLTGMLEQMCADRGATFHAPPRAYRSDNAAMIAVLGAKMAEADDTLSLEDSTVRPNFRPDQVPVTWRSDEPTPIVAGTATDIQGAEATVTIDRDAGTVRKERRPKAYRTESLDHTLRARRTASEARLISLARRHGVPTPLVRDVDPAAAVLTLQYIGDGDLRDAPKPDAVRAVGHHLASLHQAGVVHGDPTTRNVRIGPDRVSLIDFGLGYHTDHVEDFAMDLHVFAQSLGATVDEPAPLVEAFHEGYLEAGDPAVLERLEAVEGRGRYESA